ncbi:MAG: hypothetical protein ACMZ63_07595 [Methylotenera sp.]
MSIQQYTLAAITTILLSACATTTNKIDTSRLTLVKENHAEISVNNVSYVLDSYIKPFQRPYYIAVTSTNKVGIEKGTAIEVASQYIKPRGCTTPISLRPDLNQMNADKTSWIIGIEC